MDNVRLVRILVRSWWFILVVTLAGAAGGLIVFAHTTPLYASSTQLYLPVNGSPTNEAALSQAATVQAGVLAQLASKPPGVADAAKTVGRTGTGLSVTAVAEPNTTFIDIVVRGADRAAVQAVANGYADSLAGTASRLGTSLRGLTVAQVAAASYPADPYTPRLAPDLLLGIAAGLVLSLSVVAVREFLQQAPTTVEDLAELTGLRVLSGIPRQSRGGSLPAVDDPQGLRAEAFRQVRAAVLSMPASSNGVLVITSALPREGKTSVAANLAVVLARAEHTVALVDADLRRPQVAKFFGLAEQPSVGDVLSGRVVLTDAIVSREDDYLHIVPAERATAEDASELLGRPSLAVMIKELQATHRFVLIDTPPVLPVADALTVAAQASGVVLVSHLGRTGRESIRRTVDVLTAADLPLLGVVANRVGTANGPYYGYASTGRGPRRTPRPVARREPSLVAVAPVPGDEPAQVPGDEPAQVPGDARTAGRRPGPHGPTIVDQQRVVGQEPAQPAVDQQDSAARRPKPPRVGPRPS